MARHLRVEYPGAIYHVTCRTNYPTTDVCASKSSGSEIVWAPQNPHRGKGISMREHKLRNQGLMTPNSETPNSAHDIFTEGFLCILMTLLETLTA